MSLMDTDCCTEKTMTMDDVEMKDIAAEDTTANNNKTESTTSEKARGKEEDEEASEKKKGITSPRNVPTTPEEKRQSDIANYGFDPNEPVYFEEEVEDMMRLSPSASLVLSPVETVLVASLRPEAKSVKKRQFKVPKNAIMDAEFFSVLLSNPSCSLIEIPSRFAIRDSILRIVLEFLMYRFDNPEKKEDMDRKALDKKTLTELDPWDQNFIESLDIPTLLRVLLAANALHIPSLLFLAEKQFAIHVRNTKPDDLAQLFAIPADVPPEDRKP
jgi:hypothetical protein